MERNNRLKIDRDFVINNVIAGVYTNSDKYMKRFTDNWQEYNLGIELIYNVRDGKINENMERLRIDFRENHSEKRYWLFMDDDILFTRNDVVECALTYMRENDLALISVYQTRDKKLLNDIKIKNLTFEHITWSAGYFMLIDAEKIGTLPFDQELPTKRGSLADIEYCMKIIRDNHLIGIAPNYIFHEDSGFSPSCENPFKITKKNEIEVNKSVKSFFKHLNKKYFYGNPEMEIVFLDSGKIDEDETIGHQYLKWKYPDIHNEVVARKHYDRIYTKENKKFTNQL